MASTSLKPTKLYTQAQVDVLLHQLKQKERLILHTNAILFEQGIVIGNQQAIEETAYAIGDASTQAIKDYIVPLMHAFYSITAWQQTILALVSLEDIRAVALWLKKEKVINLIGGHLADFLALTEGQDAPAFYKFAEQTQELWRLLVQVVNGKENGLGLKKYLSDKSIIHADEIRRAMLNEYKDQGPLVSAQTIIIGQRLAKARDEGLTNVAWAKQYIEELQARPNLTDEEARILEDLIKRHENGGDIGLQRFLQRIYDRYRKLQKKTP